MRIEIHPHALIRAKQRQTTENQIRATIETGEQFPAKEDRMGFRRNFHFASTHNGKFYETIQLIVIAAKMPYGWLVVTVITKFF